MTKTIEQLKAEYEAAKVEAKAAQIKERDAYLAWAAMVDADKRGSQRPAPTRKRVFNPDTGRFETVLA